MSLLCKLEISNGNFCKLIVLLASCASRWQFQMLSLNDLIEVILKFKPSRLISLKSLLMQVIWPVWYRDFICDFSAWLAEIWWAQTTESVLLEVKPPPPNPSLVPYIWDLQTSVTIISLACVSQKIIYPIYTKNVHWLTFELWMTCCSDYFCFIWNCFSLAVSNM